MNMPGTTASDAQAKVAAHATKPVIYVVAAFNHLPEGVWWTYNTRGVG